MALIAGVFRVDYYAGHSFCIEAAMTVASHGMPDSLIKMLGRWESAAYTLYVTRFAKTCLYALKEILRYS